MALWPVDRFERMMMEDPMRAMDRFGGMGDMDHWMSRRMMPYWRDADHSMLHVGNQKESSAHSSSAEEEEVGDIEPCHIIIMALWPVDRLERMMMEDPMRMMECPMRTMDRFGGMGDMDRWMTRRMMPYWRDADHSMLHVGNTTKEWALPEDCDLDAVHTQLDNEGHLSIEAPKTGQHTKSRVLPILPAPKKK
ncbi:unnamed protein product [Nippostrongylus brasiliensis]|uniref:SHSP domain-containing protein n=1 Tax=Nippostrongylus brasiliensis TaxID=27835 RepID=A0A0N4XWH6_NIPBR|nr:unnamed protein product [Nippostrongylus brasiliensis]